MAFDIVNTLIGLLITIVIMVIFVVPALWIAGRLCFFGLTVNCLF